MRSPIDCNDPNADPAAAVAGRAKENLTPADFRTAQERASQFDATTATKLQEKGVDTSSIDPPTTTLAEKSGGGHKIEQVTKGPKVYPFDYNGSEVADDGRFTYEFDVKGRMFRATEKTIATTKRRVTYDYSATGRVIGRRAEYTTDGSTWKLEDRPEIVNADGLPAETTFVWDAITDRLITVANANSGAILKQIIHGDQSYDDPLETASIEPGTNAVNYLYPIYDEAGGGSLQAVLNKKGEIVARNLPLDPYGGDNAALAGAAVDRVSVTAKKNSDSTLAEVTVEIRATDALAAGTIAGGVRLAAVDAAGAVVRTTTVTPTLADANTVRWTLTPAQWTTLTAQPAAALSVAVTAALRASSWSSGIPLLPAPEWIKVTKPVFSSPSLPVEVRESLTSLTTFINATTTETTTKLYESENLALAVSGTGNDAVFEDVLSARMHAHPFTEPMTGLDYVRARWYQPLSGTWLTPDPLGYRDSSNLYAFAGGDPVNGRDPAGLAASVSQSGWIIGRTPEGRTYKLSPAYIKAHPDLVQLELDNDSDLSDERVEEIMAQVGFRALPVGGGCRRGEACISDPRSSGVPVRHLPKEGWKGYVKGGLIALANGSTSIGPTLTHDTSYVPIPTTSREQQKGEAVVQVAGATLTVVGATRGVGRGKASATEPVDVALGEAEGNIQVTRINQSSEGMTHVVNRHFSGKPNASQFTIPEGELRALLASPEVVKSPVVRPLYSEDHAGLVYVREVNVGRVIGIDKMTGRPTTTMTIMTTRDGTLITTFPGVVNDALGALP